jgi:hypothetical protein
MTRLETDLTAAILDETLVPDAAPILANLPTAILRRTRRRRALAAATAVVAVAAALAVPWALRQTGTGRPQPAATTPAPPVLTSPVAGDTVRMSGYGRTAQSGLVRAGGLAAMLSVWHLAPGADPRAMLPGATATTVNGQFGYVSVQTTTDQTFIELVWNYAPGARAALLQCPDPIAGGGRCARTEAEMRTLAATVTFGASAPVLVPVRVGYLPPGYALIDANNLDAGMGRPTLTARPYATVFDFAGPAGPTDRYQVRVEAVTSLDVTATSPMTPDHQAGGHPAQWDPVTAPGSLLVDLGTCRAWVHRSDGTQPRAVLDRIAAGLTAADCTDASTWFDGPSAIPGGDAPMTPPTRTK